MDQTPDNATSLETERPSWMSRALRGFGSGVFSGTLMMGIYNIVLIGAALAGFGGGWAALEIGHNLAVGAIGILTTGLFGAVMAASKQAEEQPKIVTTDQAGAQAVIVPTLGYAMQPTRDVADDNSITADDDTEQSLDTITHRNKSWAATVNRNVNNSNRRNLHQIIADGKMSDKDRAAAILAEREVASAEDKTASMA